MLQASPTHPDRSYSPPQQADISGCPSRDAYAWNALVGGGTTIIATEVAGGEGNVAGDSVSVGTIATARWVAAGDGILVGTIATAPRVAGIRVVVGTIATIAEGLCW